MNRALVAAGALLAAGAALSLEADKLYERASRSVFVVVASNLEKGTTSAGSGVVVAPGKMVTSCRVVAGATRIRVERDNASYGASLEHADPKRDLCQLQVKDLTAPPATLGSSAGLRIGQRVYAIGAPKGAELTLAEGLVSSLRAGADADAPRIQTTVPLAPGSSGGGLFDSDGRLVAITTWKQASADSQNLAFAIPAEWIQDLPARSKADPAELKAPEAPTASTASTAARDPGLAKQMPQAGDTWTYVALDLRYKPRDRTRKYVHTIRSASETGITEEVVSNGEPLGEFTFTPEPAGALRGGVLELAPFAGAFRPLRPGDAWGSMPVRGANSGSRFAPTWKLSSARVVSTETLTVPAGTFETIKMVARGYVYTSGATAGATMGTIAGYRKFTGTTWYAPAVKRVVKHVIEGDMFTDGYELESYSLR